METSTPPTGAAAWSRAARLTVGPTATNSEPARSPPSVLTTTSPVSMPTRIRGVTPNRRSTSSLSAAVAAVMASPARTARSASSS